MADGASGNGGTTGRYDVAVIGLGQAGLPLAVLAGHQGLSVLGIDADRSRVASLASGLSYVADVSDTDLVEVGPALDTSSSLEGVVDAAAIVVCINVADDSGKVDLARIDAVASDLGKRLTGGQLVSVESTVPPGTTGGRFRAGIESTSGMEAGRDFFLCYSPTRIDPGNERWPLGEIPKVVAADDPESLRQGTLLYSRLVGDVVKVTGIKEAELAKVLENLYRHVNITLVNEMAVLAEAIDADIWETVRAASTKPFGFQAFSPGSGAGGPCIAWAPEYLKSTPAAEDTRLTLIDAAVSANAAMPAYVAGRIGATLASAGIELDGASIHLIGLAYKPGVADLRGSKAVEVGLALVAQGAVVSYTDPLVADERGRRLGFEPHADPVVAAATSDITVVLTPQPGVDLEAVASAARLFFTTRASTTTVGGERL